jgi:hypothetical protein
MLSADYRPLLGVLIQREMPDFRRHLTQPKGQLAQIGRTTYGPSF